MKVGHASGSETKTKNGVAGDQTKKEVCVTTYSDTSTWTCLLRAKDSSLRERMAKACEAGCANNNIGYSQATRNTAHTKAKLVNYDLSKINVKCNTDCSAFMTLCAIAAGVKELEYSGNAPTTSTMQNAFGKTGKFEVLKDFSVKKRGDILVKAGKHTVMVLEDTPHISTSVYTFDYFVKDVKIALGVLTNDTLLAKTITVSKTKNNQHSVVKAIQKYLNSIGYNCGTADGIAGTKFDAAVKKFQKDNSCEIDGEITAKCKTWKKLLKL